MKNSIRTYMSIIAALVMALGTFTGCGSVNEKADNGTNADTAAVAGADEGGTAEAAAEEKSATADIAAAEDGAAGDTGDDAFAEYATDFDTIAKTDLAGESLMFDAAAEGFTASDFGIAEGFEGETEIYPEEGVTEEPITNYGEAFVLTAGEWNDNNNWGFFANLVNNGTIDFPSYGVDPRNRVEVTLTNGGEAAANKSVELLDTDGSVIWTAKTDKNGKAYLFYTAGQEIAKVRCGEAEAEVGSKASSDEQGNSKSASSVSAELEAEGETYGKTEVMFILDTTGSMGDEIAYLQKDFSSIAEEVSAANQNITFSVNFYRDEGDEYVTKTNPFTADVKELQALLNAEYADGGGDWPEAVAEILDETITNGSWSEDTNKVAFLIFDAPPHEGKEEVLNTAIKAAAEKGIHIVPVVSSNSERDTELFGRAIAACTNSNYVFLTDDSGVGGSHLEPIIGDYDVELLHDIIVRNINEIAE